jgi:hypothetical protein
MSLISINKTDEKIYNPSRIPQRRNPIYSKKFKPILCQYCEETVQSVRGRKPHYRTLNQLWAHIVYEHSGIDFKPYLMSLADGIISGEWN